MNMKKVEKVLCALKTILNDYKNKISIERYEYSTGIIGQFEKWSEDKSLFSYELYDLLFGSDESEENTIFDFAEPSSLSLSEDKETMHMWQVVLSVLMTIIRIACEEEKASCQQDIGSINFDKIENFYDCILEGNRSVTELFEFFNTQVCY